MHFALKIVSESGFSNDGEDLTGDLTPGADGIVFINVEGDNAVGIIDPDFGRTGANRELLLESIFLKYETAPTDDTNNGIFLVDDDEEEELEVAFRLVNLAGVTFPFYSDRRWLIPVGYRLRVNVLGDGPATLRLNFWVLDSPEQLSAARPLGEDP